MSYCVGMVLWGSHSFIAMGMGVESLLGQLGVGQDRGLCLLTALLEFPHQTLYLCAPSRVCVFSLVPVHVHEKEECFVGRSLSPMSLGAARAGCDLG